MNDKLHQTRDDLRGSYLVVCAYPEGSTPEQIDRAVDAARRVFDEAGVDPVEAGYPYVDDPDERNFLTTLWRDASGPRQRLVGLRDQGRRNRRKSKSMSSRADGRT